MPVRLGNAAAPRWWDLDPARLDLFLAYIASQGARSSELVLHHGPADDRTSRVHVLEEHWAETFAAFRRHGLSIDAHASLDERFTIARWLQDPKGLQSTYLPLLTALAAQAETQPQPVTLVVHGCDGDPTQANDLADAARAFLGWASDWIAEANARLRLSVELRQARFASDQRRDRSRASLLALVDPFDPDIVGVCWDVGHDWENARFAESWSPTPPRDFLARVNHLHLHDAGADASVHHPLDHERVPWQEQLRTAIEAGYTGAVTMEIRYRHAVALGDPWTVLARCYQQAGAVLQQSAAVIATTEP